MMRAGVGWEISLAASTAAATRASRRAVRLAGLLLTAGAVAVHVRFWTLAGGLWRDEVNSVVVAHLGSLADVWRALPYDSFPIGWHLALRAWTAVFGPTDAACRGLGLAAGLGTLAGLWWNARRFGGPAPIVALLLLGYTSAVTVHGDTVRGHGLGVCLAVLAMGLIWDLSRGVTPGRVVAALAVAGAAVHVTFYNGPVVLGVCCGGVAAATSRGRPGRAAAVAVLGVGVVAGGSLLVYVPTLRRAAAVARMAKVPWSWASTGGRLVQAVRFDPAPSPPGGAQWAWLWAAAIAGGLVVGGRAVWHSRGATDGAVVARRAVAVFGGVSLVVGVAADVGFLRVLSYPLQPWYFLAGLTLAAACLDPLYAAGLSGRWQGRVAAVAIVLAAVAVRPLWADVGVRKTDVDRAAVDLATAARPGDVVVCIPWYYAGTLLRYYHGPARVVGVPPVPTLAYQRSDEQVPFMVDPRRSLGPVQADVSAALRAGHHVWLLADPLVVGPDGPILPATRAVQGWSGAYYTAAWRLMVDSYVVRHAASLKAYDPSAEPDANGDPARPVSRYEDPLLYEAAGWRDGGDGRP